jgi:AcrR family transcriptional regulator
MTSKTRSSNSKEKKLPGGDTACARPYALGKRKEASDEARRRSIEAAKALLHDSSMPELKMEAVALRAGITRQTLYNLFGSRSELIEAVFDDLARSGGMEGMPRAMQQRDAQARLAGMIETFARFWSADRPITRRIRALAATDRVLQAAVEARDERRRAACRHVINGFLETSTGKEASDGSLLADLLFSLTSFEFFDMLAGDQRSPLEVCGTVLRLAHAAIRDLAA